MREFSDLCVDGGGYAGIGGVMRGCWRLWTFWGVFALLKGFMRGWEGAEFLLYK